MSDTQAGNVLIAEFDGWHDEVIQSFTPPNDKHYFCSPPNQPRVVLSYPILDDDLQYHTSWDWLHGVIDKIAEIITIEKPNRPMQSIEMIEMQTLGIMSKIKDVYERVIRFINWYNTQPKTNTHVKE